MDRTLGTRRLTEGPGLSARIRFIWMFPAEGKRAIKKTRTPMPPTQWVKLLQKRIQRGTLSRFVITLEPVVVKPDTVSNMASTGFGRTPLKMKGRDPIRLMMIQLKAAVTQPSFV